MLDEWTQMDSPAALVGRNSFVFFYFPLKPNLELLLKQPKGLGLLAMDKRYLWSVGEEKSEFLKLEKFWTQ